MRGFVRGGVLIGIVVTIGCSRNVEVWITAPSELAGAAIAIDGDRVAAFDADDATTSTTKGLEGQACLSRLVVSRGRHELRIEKPGYQPIVRQVEYKSTGEDYIGIARDELRPVAPPATPPAESAHSSSVTLAGDPGDCLGAPPDPNEVVPPILISRKEPVLPSDVRTHGAVSLSAVISQSGRVEAVKIVRSFTPAFDQACVDAIREWRYKPATQYGRPVAFSYTARCDFKPGIEPSKQ